MFLPALFSALLVTPLAGQAFGGNYYEAKTGCKKFVGQQVGESPEKKILLTRCVSKNDKALPGRTLFSETVVNQNGSGVNVVAMQIPAGKRLVIENVTAIVRSAESRRVEID